MPRPAEISAASRRVLACPSRMLTAAGLPILRVIAKPLGGVPLPGGQFIPIFRRRRRIVIVRVPQSAGPPESFPGVLFRAGHFLPVQVVPVAHVSHLANFIGLRGRRKHFVSHVQGASQNDESRQSQRGRSCAARVSEAYLRKSLPSLRPRQTPLEAEPFDDSFRQRSFIAPPTKDRATPRLQRTKARRSSIPR
jgi:hypothetical protein